VLSAVLHHSAGGSVLFRSCVSGQGLAAVYLTFTGASEVELFKLDWIRFSEVVCSDRATGIRAQRVPTGFRKAQRGPQQGYGISGHSEVLDWATGRVRLFLPMTGNSFFWRLRRQRSSDSPRHRGRELRLTFYAPPQQFRPLAAALQRGCAYRKPRLTSSALGSRPQPILAK
jgi:hypothetical protein